MDKIDGIRTFLGVVEAGSFTAAAGKLGVSKALVSKHVAALERRLGARLINRTTRRLAATEVGRIYAERCKRLLADFDELEMVVQERQGQVRGLLRLSAPVVFGETHLAPIIGDFLRRHPDLTVELSLTDRRVDLIEEGFDAALRITEMADSSLIARRLSRIRIVYCAAPAYLDRHGRPAHPDQLANHQCIVDLNDKTGPSWPFTVDGVRRLVRVEGRYRVNSARAVRDALIGVGGIARCPSFVVAEDIAAGRLEVVLADHVSEEIGIHLVYPHARHLAAKVRVLADFLTRSARQNPLWRRIEG
jgi:DNA-binding transcriptional LysR family regulator